MTLKDTLIRTAKAAIRGTWQTPQDFARGILADTRAVAADVGAAHGLQGQWLPLDGNAMLYLFEPFAEAAEELEHTVASKRRPDLYRVMPFALSNRTGRQPLHVTNTPTGSSLKQPFSPVMDGYSPPDYVFPIRNIEVAVSRLDDAFDTLAEPQLDFIKLDTQGAEADILEGLGAERRSRLFCVESEVNLVGAIPKGTTLAQLVDLLSPAGLEFFDLRIARGYRRFSSHALHRTEFGVGDAPMSIAARAWEADVVWFRTPDAVLATGSLHSVRKLVLAYCLYNFFTEAWHLLDRATAHDPTWREEVARLRMVVKRWHRYVRSIFPLDRPALATLFRRRERWNQYAWLPYPHS